MYDFVSYVFMFMLLLAVVGVGIALYLIVSDIFFVVREWREMRAEKERHAEELRGFKVMIARAQEADRDEYYGDPLREANDKTLCRIAEYRKRAGLRC